MAGWFNLLRPVLRPIARPVTRFIVGVLAIPLFRLMMKRVVRNKKLDEELEKDLEQWFRGSMVLLAATANMELFILNLIESVGERAWMQEMFSSQYGWLTLGLRLLLAISVIEFMPDQELFSIIHPGPPKLNMSRKYGIWREIWEKRKAILKGYLCHHVNRSSPVLAILAAIYPGWIGWAFYGVAITQYLIIGLVTSRDRALDVLGEFDKQIAIRRRELIEEFDIEDSPPPPDCDDGETDDDGTPIAPVPDNLSDLVPQNNEHLDTSVKTGTGQRLPVKNDD